MGKVIRKFNMLILQLKQKTIKQKTENGRKSEIMKKSSCVNRTVAVAVLSCLGFSAAKAAMVNYTIVNSEADLETFNLSYNSSGTTLNSTINGALVGGIQISQSGNSAFHSSYTTVCTDVGNSVYLGSTYGYDLTTYSGLTGIDPVWGLDANNGINSTLLKGEQAKAIQNAAEIFYNNYALLSSGTSVTVTSGLGGTAVDKMAALQLAVWAAIYDTGLNGNVEVTSGGNGLSGTRFAASGGDAAAIADAALMIANLNGNYNLTGNLLFPDPNTTQGNGDGNLVQELLMRTGDTTATPVPEPTTMVAGALLLLPFGASTLRMLRTRRTA